MAYCVGFATLEYLSVLIEEGLGRLAFSRSSEGIRDFMAHKNRNLGYSHFEDGFDVYGPQCAEAQNLIYSRYCVYSPG